MVTDLITQRNDKGGVFLVLVALFWKISAIVFCQSGE